MNKEEGKKKCAVGGRDYKENMERKKKFIEEDGW